MFITEMKSFLSVYNRYLTQKSQDEVLYVSFGRDNQKSSQHYARDWKNVYPAKDNQIIDYDHLPSVNAFDLSKLAVLKLNGGLGSSMGNL